MYAKRLKKKDIKYIAKGLLHDFKEPSEFKNAKISGIWPIYFMQAFNQYLFRKPPEGRKFERNLINALVAQLG